MFIVNLYISYIYIPVNTKLTFIVNITKSHDCRSGYFKTLLFFLLSDIFIVTQMNPNMTNSQNDFRNDTYICIRYEVMCAVIIGFETPSFSASATGVCEPAVPTMILSTPSHLDEQAILF